MRCWLFLRLQFGDFICQLRGFSGFEVRCLAVGFGELKGFFQQLRMLFLQFLQGRLFLE